MNIDYYIVHIEYIAKFIIHIVYYSSKPWRGWKLSQKRRYIVRYHKMNPNQLLRGNGKWLLNEYFKVINWFVFDKHQNYM